MALGCIKWRNQFNVANLLSEGEEILDRAELESAKSYYSGKDKEGRPCWWVETSPAVRLLAIMNDGHITL